MAGVAQADVGRDAVLGLSRRVTCGREAVLKVYGAHESLEPVGSPLALLLVLLPARVLVLVPVLVPDEHGLVEAELCRSRDSSE